MSTSRASERAGFTLLEILISATILAGLLTIALQSLSGSTTQINQSLILDQMRMEANQALHKIAQDLKASEWGAVSVTASGAQLRLQRTEVSIDPNTQAVTQNYSAQYLYELSSGQLVMNYITRRGLANNVTAFSAMPSSGVAEDPLTSETVTLTLTLTRQVGVKSDGTPQNLTVTATRTVYVRPNL